MKKCGPENFPHLKISISVSLWGHHLKLPSKPVARLQKPICDPPDNLIDPAGIAQQRARKGGGRGGTSDQLLSAVSFKSKSFPKGIFSLGVFQTTGFGG